MTADQTITGPGTSLGGVTVVLPAYREEANLANTVEDMLGTLGATGVEHSLVIVNDGSPDRTGEVADELAQRYPGRIHVVHHEANKGYGAAVRTGIATALELTDSPRLFLTDSDGQFKAAQLPRFLSEAHAELADAVIGFRPRRADPPLRKINAWLWTRACRLLLGVPARDVDCAYKLVDRRVLDGVELRGDAALISPELLVNIRARGGRILQRPVEHFPREHGEQTGARLSVILVSLLGLLGLWWRRVGEFWPARALRRMLQPRDPAAAAVTAAAVVASVVSYLVFDARHVVLAYPDAVSHLLIARRVVSASTPGAAQLGGVWLPLPHLLEVPTVWISSWYYSGFSGSLVSMASYVVTARYLHRIGLGMTGSRVAGVVAAAVFALNPNVLYLQSTPMTELLLLACVAGCVYHLMRWCQTDSYPQLAATALAALLASLTRYEGWVLDVAVLAVVGYVAYVRARRSRFRQAEAHLLFYGVPALAGIVGWAAWNAVIFGSPFNFQNGAYARPSLWVSGTDKAVGHLGTSLVTYILATADNIGWAAFGTGLIGLGCYLARTRLKAETLAPLALLCFFPFYVWSLYAAQRPLYVTQLYGSLYNVRFGVLMTLPAAVFSSYLVVAFRRRGRSTARRLRVATAAALCCAVAASVAAVAIGGIDTLKEPEAFRASAAEQANARAGAWLRAHYTGGKVLIESFGNETVTFDSRIPSSQMIYEGSYRQWQPSLRYPEANGIRWIYMRRARGDQDQVWSALHASPELAQYQLVYADPDRLIYRER